MTLDVSGHNGLRPPHVVVVAAALLSLGFAACGSAHSAPPSSPAKTTVASTSTPQTPPAPPEDQDKDREFHSHPSYYDYDDYNTPNYPDAASTADTRAVTVLVKGYLGAAAAGNGAKACSLLYSLFAETIPETYGEPPYGSPALRGSTCSEVMTKLFKMDHRQLSGEVATLQVTSVRVNGRRGLALLHFRGIPARSINVHDERGTWKLDELLDTEVP